MCKALKKLLAASCWLLAAHRPDDELAVNNVVAAALGRAFDFAIAAKNPGEGARYHVI
jgi:hypothetical protein